MNIVTFIDSHAGSRSNTWYRVKELLVNQAGWVVRGSSDGTTGGLDDVDRWSSETASSSSNSWLVLESPHIEVADRIQIMFGQAANSQFRLRYCPNADYAGGDTTTMPTSAAGDIDMYNNVPTDGNFSRTHVLADADFPYGFALQSTGSSPPIAIPRVAVAVCPLVSTSVGSGKPYAVYMGRTFGVQVFSNRDTSPSLPGWATEGMGPGTPPIMSNALRFSGEGIAVDNYGRFLPGPGGAADGTHPLIIGRYQEHYYGASNFARPVTYGRPPFTTYNNRTRISLGYLTFPWDGVTQPNPFFRPFNWVFVP